MSKLSAAPDVLVSIRKQKKLLRKEIATSQTVITDSVRTLVSPVTRIGNQGRSMSSLVSRGMAIFEGVRIGLRLMNSMRMLFGRRKRR